MAMQGVELKPAKGDWVFHPRMPDWGYGKVLEVLGESKGRVFFLLAGEKILSWEHADLGKVESDIVSQAALNDQLSEFKVKLAKDLLTSEELRHGVTCSACESPSSRCELCKCASESLRIYSFTQRGKMCLCDACRDRIMLETQDRAAIEQSITEMKKRSKKAASDSKKKKLKAVKK
jgi:hypothetical protein